MKRVWQAVFSFVIMGVGIWAVRAAYGWPWKAALFPIVVGIPIMVLAGIEGILTLRGRMGEESNQGVDMQFTEEISPTLVRQRTLHAFAWFFGFFGMIVLVGFQDAVPLFVFLYLMVQAREKWLLSLALTLCASEFFYTLFVQLLPLPFPDRWIPLPFPQGWIVTLFPQGWRRIFTLLGRWIFTLF